MQVILIFEWHNHFSRSFLLLKWFILMRLNRTCHLTNRHWVSGWYIFIITLNVRILPTMQVILIFEWHYHFSISFLLLKWFILMRLNSTCHLINRHWVSRWYIFIITINVRTLPIIQVILHFEWRYHFSRSFLLLKWFILMRLNRTCHLTNRHWVSRWYIFIITLNVRILPTMQVILNFDWHYQFNRSFLPLKWFILMRLIRTWHLISCHWVSRWYIFIITINVRILPTMQVILNFDWHYQFSRSFLLLKWFILMRLIRTWHLIRRHWVSRWYIFIINLNVRILPTMQVILNFDWHYQFSRSFLLLKWLILMRLIRTWHLISRHWVSRWYIFIITLNVKVLPTMQVIFNFDWHYQFNRSFLPLKWFILMRLIRTWHLISCHWVSRWYIFIITINVRILPTMQVILNFDWHYQFNRWFLPLKWFILMRLIRTWHLISRHWASRWYTFIITINVRILPTMQVILNFDWHYQFSRSFLLLKWFILMRLIRTWHLISRHWVSRWYIFIITLNVRILPTMQVILNFDWHYQFNRSFLPLKWFILMRLIRTWHLISCHWVSRWYILIITINVRILPTMQVILNFDWLYQFNRWFLPLKWFILMRLIRTWHLISRHWVSRWYIFIITLNVRILPRMQVILNFDWHYQFNRSFLPLKWFILMRLIRTWHLISRHWVSRWYIFIITLNVRILPTMQVILNFDWHDQFNRSFLPLKWFILMRLIRTWHLIRHHWVSRWYIFIITLNVRILPRMQVILNFDWHYQFNRSFLPLKWFILMRLIRTWHLISRHWVSRWYIFIITLNIRILPTMQVILNFDWHDQFNRSFLPLKWFILMRLIRTWHLIRHHWVSRWYIFIITLNVRILPTMQVILNFDWHYQFNRSFLLLKWFILMRLNRTCNLTNRHWVSRWYIFIITLNVRILPTMQVILNFDWHYQFNRSFLILKWFILMRLNMTCHLTKSHWVSRLYIFIITINVRILPTMQVILNFDWHYQFSRSFLPLKWFILMRLIRTWHLISRHWASRWYIFIITLNVRILPTMQVMLNFDWQYQFKRSFLLLKWFILMRLIRTWHLISRHWASRLYIFIITLNVRILPTMQVILNFDWHDQFNRSFLPLKWFILMRLIRTWHLIRHHWVSRWYIFIITLNVRILPTMQVILNFDWHY